MAVVRRSLVFAVAAGFAFAGTAMAQSPSAGDPPARVGRLSYLQGTVSYHDAQADAWSPAAVNTPLTAGDSLWTEPSGHDELSISGTRVRMDGDSQMDVLALDDSQTRLQLDQGQLDIKTFALETNQPYQIVTPRGIAALKDQGDYYVHAGTTADPTVMGVRSGAAEFQAPNGQTVALRGGEEAQVTGDGDSIQIRKVNTAPPAMPTYWAQRDQQINYTPVQYLGADVTGYEDLGAYGSWSNDPDYGQVWAPQGVAVDWTPYSTGHWAYVDPYGWSWVDSAPWGYAPYHYGRWAHRNSHWFWVPPDRHEHAVYAPALVSFVGGTELGIALGIQSQRPVGWFPLGPREAYVPPYTADRRYYQRINANARVPEAALNDRWQRAEHHQALTADDHNEAFANRRFATVVPAEAFARSQPVQQARLHFAADKINSAPVAAVAAPPAPTLALAAHAAAKPGQPAQPQAQTLTRPGQPQPGQPATAQTRFAAMETIARPTPNAARQHAAPGPRFTSTQPNAPTAPGTKPSLPQLAPHGGTAPKPGEPPHPNAATASPQTPALPGRPGEPPRPNEQHPAQPQANQAVQPEHRPGEPPRPGEPTHPGQPQANQAQPPHPGQPPPRPGEPPHPQANQAVQPHPGEPPRPNEQHAPPPQVNHAVQAPHQAEPPHPQANVAPPPQHPAPQPQAQPQHMSPPAQQQVHTAPPPQAPHPAAPPPQMPQAHAAPPPPPHPAAPPPQMQHAAPPPQMQHAPPQAQAPHPAPPPPAPHPAPPPQQAQQAPHPAPAPQAQPQQKKPGEK